MRTRALLVLLCIVPGWAAAAATVEIELAAAMPGVRCEITSFDAEPLNAPVVFDGESKKISVAIAERPVDLMPVAKGCWAAPLHIPAELSAPLVVELWPSAEVIGGIAFEKKSDDPRAIAGSLFDTTGDARRVAVSCALDSKLWRCHVPAGRSFHLQVAVDDYAPLFVWDLRPEPNAVLDTGIQTLVRGAAVTGRAVLDEGRPAANARVRILPLSAGHQSTTDRAAKLRETRTSSGGHFQIAGLEPGLYRLQSMFDGRGDAVLESIELRAGEHLQLRDPLVHAQLAELTVLVTPPVSTAQKPWTVELLRKGERDMEMVSIAKTEASVDGTWTRGRLQPAEYHLRVFATNGSEMVARDVVLRGGTEEIVVDISSIGVTGKVVSGDDGVAAALVFDKDRLRVTATSNEEGAFTAEFPVEGMWKPGVTLGSTTIKLDPIEIERSKDLVLRVPGGGVRGKVLDTNGKPVAGAYVRLKREVPIGTATSEADGTYEIVGIAAGAYVLDAEANDAFGGPVQVSIAKDDVSEVDLQLQAFREVTGVVTTASGAMASGAVVRSFDPVTSAVEDTIADARGAFSFRVAPRSAFVDIIVLAPPAPVAVRRVAMGERRSVSTHVQLSPVGTKLRVFIPRVPPFPTLAASDGGARSLGLLLMPRFESGMWRELVDGGFNLHVEPGPYRLCYPSTPCRELQLAAHAETVVILPPPTNVTGTE